ncbi:kinase-like domain-containing protein [Jimgerdemannia flammicorona]|uniref:Kinase-like domain-containing protein n=1 Tax=Jimgerdemannia flammicorona TaxID=994334 RepID=A0A433DJM2_9FUNG|nr:kinase-like domain-containing protein [Jimgerdemannia flammicorona]
MGSLQDLQLPEDQRWNDVISSARAIAKALEEIHKLGFLHHDLHPGNVVFLSLKYPILIDIGLAQAIEDAQDESGAYGRLDYLPPEVFDDKPYTTASDIYCLGTVIWQLITGVPPQETSAYAVHNRADKLREDPIPGAPDALMNIIKDCWNLDSAQRPSARQVVMRLDQAVTMINPDVAIWPLPEEIEALKWRSPATMLFVAERRAAHQQSLTESDTFSYANGNSQFYSSAQLRVVSEKHTVSSLQSMAVQSDV